MVPAMLFIREVTMGEIFEQSQKTDDYKPQLFEKDVTGNQMWTALKHILSKWHIPWTDDTRLGVVMTKLNRNAPFAYKHAVHLMEQWSYHHYKKLYDDLEFVSDHHLKMHRTYYAVGTKTTNKLWPQNVKESKYIGLIGRAKNNVL